MPFLVVVILLALARARFPGAVAVILLARARFPGAVAAAAAATVVDEVDLFLAAALVGADTRVAGTTSSGGGSWLLTFFLLRGTTKVGGVGFKLASAARRNLVGRDTRLA